MKEFILNRPHIGVLKLCALRYISLADRRIAGFPGAVSTDLSTGPVEIEAPVFSGVL
jgi:hypothetical protein